VMGQFDAAGNLNQPEGFADGSCGWSLRSESDCRARCGDDSDYQCHRSDQSDRDAGPPARRSTEGGQARIDVLIATPHSRLRAAYIIP